MTPRIQDYGHREADRKLRALTKRLHLSYRQASASLSKKISDYLDQFEKEDAYKRALYDSGELSHEDYLKWRQKHIIETKQWRDMRDQLTIDMVNQDKIAASMINDTLPEIYAENHNYGTYEAEVGSGIDTTYTMYDKNTVAGLMKEERDVLPYPDPSVNVRKDKLWNRQHIQSAVLQGVLTGESMDDIAKRFQDVVDMDENSAIRNARTAVTGAENAGRIDSYLRAQKMGIDIKQIWIATLDNRVRDSHARLDGEKRNPGEKFSNGCRYPGDPSGVPAEIYNCRCTLIADVEGADEYDLSGRTSAYLQENGLTYDDWKKMHQLPKGSKLTDAVSKTKEKITTLVNDNTDEEYRKFKAKNIKNDMTILCEKNGLKRISAHKLKSLLTEEEIINKICVDDASEGSCVSLAYSYAANKIGLDITDYRRGKSIGIFANFGWFEIAETDGVWYKENKENINDFVKAGKLLSQMEPKKEYILSIGTHTAVVRKKEAEYEYLELQKTNKTGFKKLNYDSLKNRFKCSTEIGEYLANIVEIESLRDNDDFRAIVEYINTNGG